MFQKVLIANRGAIAVRIIRTLKRMGIIAVTVYAESDHDSLHVSQADESYSLGEGAAKETYLDMDKLIAIAKAHNVDAIHPGYGFLSENAEFVSLCEENGIAFIGPTAQQIIDFGLKHKARALAVACDMPLSPGTGLLESVDEACAAAENIGYPVMLKTTAGGGGIGMQLCNNTEELTSAFESIKHLGSSNFSNDGIFLEKFIAHARHVEVQVFGDGKGKAVALGERDCSCQRRNQKVIEECPAPRLSDTQRDYLHSVAAQFLASVNYRNAGTVEFIYDESEKKFYFLEVNTRLQVEHGVTEEVYQVDIVEWMVKLAAGELGDIEVLAKALRPHGHALQCRVYAEDPYKHFQPSPGFISQADIPQEEGLRIDHWISAGITVPPYFDPMLAKIIVKSESRETSIHKMQRVLSQTHIYGCETNIDYLQALLADEKVLNAQVTTRYLNQFKFHSKRIDILSGGTQTTIQDLPGRQHYWNVGIPPSGPFDRLSFALGNRLLGNPENAAGLEMTVIGPTLKFSIARHVVVTGADIAVSLDDSPVPLWQVILVDAGQVLKFGRLGKKGANSYLLVEGGIQCPDYLGAKSTFTLGQFGGHDGRAIRTGDVLHLSDEAYPSNIQKLPVGLKPSIENDWQIRVTYGPHGALDYFTPEDIKTIFATKWQVHYDSNRTGVRLIGPKPMWARKDGGEAGLHPSNIHDNAYAFGTMDFTGDMPILLGPDGPSLGGFVCPMTVITADLWKIGQLHAGDTVSFTPVSVETAAEIENNQQKSITDLAMHAGAYPEETPVSPIIATLNKAEYGDTVTYRVSGDHFLLIEYGEPVLSLRLRFRVHALMQWLDEHPLAGLRDLTPGIRSLQIHFDSQVVTMVEVIKHLQKAEKLLADHLDEMTVPSRKVYLPLSWDDEACHKAIEIYDQVVRKNAPWYPSNLEFIRRINGLGSIDDVKEILFSAQYLVMGLGDVYLGAPVATPVDPRQRLVTTKYNPARTWTAENSVGIGGSYLCVYGMEGPGGYQFVGRTMQMWNRYHKTAAFNKPYLLRFFDRVQFFPVSHDELMQIRKDVQSGRYNPKIENGEFSLAEYQKFHDENKDSINAFYEKRNTAFQEELARWHRDGQFQFESKEPEMLAKETVSIPDGANAIESPVTGSVWKVLVKAGDNVSVGQNLCILEAMKMEIPIQAESDGTVLQMPLDAGQKVIAGDVLAVVGGNS